MVGKFFFFYKEISLKISHKQEICRQYLLKSGIIHQKGKFETEKCQCFINIHIIKMIILNIDIMYI